MSGRSSKILCVTYLFSQKSVLIGENEEENFVVY